MASYSLFRSNQEGIVLPPDPAELRGVPPDQLAVWLSAMPPARHDPFLLRETEAWSRFRAGGFQFVARTVVSTGTRGGPHRMFTHARAWKIADSQPGSDFGALLGRSELFASNADSAVRVMSLPDPEPAMVWEPVLRQYKDVAIRLASQIYRARVAGRRVVITAEPDEFAPDGRLPGLIAFARAALPAVLKRDLDVRIYAQEPALFSATGIAVVMTSDAERGSLLLSIDGNPWDPSESCDLTWGKTLVSRSLELPQAFFSFTNRFRPELPVRAASAVYNFTAVRGNREHMDELLEYCFQRTPGLPWKEILTAEEWSAFGDDVLRKLAFARIESPDGTELQRFILAELLKRPRAYLAGLEKWWAEKTEGREIRLLQLIAEELIPTTSVVSLIGQIEPNRIPEILKNEALLPILAGATAASGAPTAGWVTAFLELEDPYTPLGIILKEAGDASRWKESALAIFDRIIVTKKPVPIEAAPLIRQLLPRQTAAECLTIAEMLFRAVADPAERRKQGIPANILTTIKLKEQRRWLLEQRSQERWTCLQSFFIPDDWLGDTADLLPLKDLTKREIAQVVKALPVGETLPEALGALLDLWMRDQQEAITLALLERSRWVAWRSSSRLTPIELEGAAIAWLTANSTKHTLRGWEFAIADIGTLTKHKVGLIAARKRWPWIVGSENRQLQDVLSRVGDAAVYAALCDLSEKFVLAKVPIEVIAAVAGSAIKGDSSVQTILNGELGRRGKPPAPPKPPPLPVAAAVASPPPLPGAAGPGAVLKALAAGSLTAPQACVPLSKTPAKAIYDLLDPKAAVDPALKGKTCAEWLATLEFPGGIPKEWRDQLPAMGTPQEAAEHLLPVTLANEKLLGKRGSIWSPALFDALRRLLAESKAPSRELGAQLATRQTYVSKEDWATNLELACRSGAATAETNVRQIRGWEARDWRRWVSEHREDKRWTFLSKLDDPPEWDRDCADILLANPERLKKISADPERLVAILAGLPDAEVAPAALDGLDRAIRIDMQGLRTVLRSPDHIEQLPIGRALRTTSALIDRGQWMRWRSASRLDKKDLRDAAKAWFMDCRPGRGSPIEEWNQCIADLKEGGLSGPEIAEIRRHAYGGQFLWPFLTEFRTRQIEDLFKVAGDLDALAEIAETTSEPGKIQELPREGASLGALRMISKIGGHQREVAITALCDAVLKLMNSDPMLVIAEADAEPSLWRYEPFVARLLRLLVEQNPPDAFVRAAEDRLRGCPFSVVVNSDSDKLRTRARWFRERGSPAIAGLLSGGLAKKLITDTISSLLGATSDLSVWFRISGLVQSGDLDPDPLRDLLQALKNVPAEQLTPTVTDKAWAVLLKAYVNHGNLAYRNGNRVPIFEIGAFLMSGQTLPDIAVGLIRANNYWCNDAGWWEALFNSVRQCERMGGERRFEDRTDRAVLGIVDAVKRHMALTKKTLTLNLDEVARLWLKKSAAVK